MSSPHSSHWRASSNHPNEGFTFWNLRRTLLVEWALVAATIGPLTCALCAIGITWDIHQARLEHLAVEHDLQRESLRRVDALLWKADTALEIAGAWKLDLGSLLTKVRAQVKEAADTSVAASKTQTKQATQAVTQALASTTEAIKQVADQAVVVPEKLKADKPVVIESPAPVVIQSAPVVTAPPDAALHVPPPPKQRPWWKRLFPWNWH